MGLGKTLQALALICRARLVCPEQPPFLVVAPTSVVSNWSNEAAKFAPDLRVVCLTESESKRSASSGSALAEADVVITSYALLRIDNEKLAGLEWSGVILDEAQFVKNHRAKTYQCARRLAAPFKLAITGTPLENSLMDLWALLSIAAPGLFPDPDRFSEYYRRPIERNKDAIRLRQLRRRIRPLMLRRTKESVATELPPKQEQVVEVELHPKHRRIYQTHLQRERQKVLGLIEDLDRNRFTVLRSLTLLRRLSLDAALVDETQGTIPAAKTDVLLQDLGELVGEGHQALVFSQFTTFLSRIRHSSGRGRDPLRVPGRAYQESRTGNPKLSGQDRVGIPHQSEGGRLRAQPRGGRLLLRTGSVVEPGYRGPGGGSYASDRPNQDRDGLSAGGQGHHRTEGDGPESSERGALLGGRRRRGTGWGSSHCRGNPRASRQLAMCCSVMRAMQCEVTRGACFDYSHIRPMSTF